MSELLVSVRSPEEALTALSGGAALIDVKEPGRGALGRPDDEVIHAIAAAIGGRRPVSAALGEWADETHVIPDAPLTYVKFGLAGCARRSDWRAALGRLLTEQRAPQLVLVAYADSECAQAPSVDDIFSLAAEHPGSVLLLDTHCKEANNVVRKERPTLLDWLPRSWIEDLCGRCRSAGVKIALAGSLGLAEIDALFDSQPDWFAVRGAVCEARNRQGGIQLDKVQQLAARLSKAVMPAHAS